MESLLKSMSNSNMTAGGGIGGSNANLYNLLQSMQGHSSAASLFGQNNNPSAVSLANLLRQESQTGLSTLRMQEGLNNRQSSVDDFLSLVAAGDIPHTDPSLLNIPLMQQQGGQEAAAKFLQQQILQAQASGNAALANALASRSLSNLHGLGDSSGQSSGQNKRKLDDVGDASEQGAAKK
jgi:hypothetical protein